MKRARRLDHFAYHNFISERFVSGHEQTHTHSGGLCSCRAYRERGVEPRAEKARVFYGFCPGQSATVASPRPECATSPARPPLDDASARKKALLLLLHRVRALYTRHLSLSAAQYI